VGATFYVATVVSRQAESAKVCLPYQMWPHISGCLRNRTRQLPVQCSAAYCSQCTVVIFPKTHSNLCQPNSMSQAAPAPSSSSNFLAVFSAALETYEKTTKNKLFTHPFAAQLQSCESPADILSVLQGLVQQVDQNRSNDQGLVNWLGPTVNVLFAFSATLGEGVGLVGLKSLSHENPNSEFRFSGILACKSDLCWDRCLYFGADSSRFSLCWSL